MSKAGEMIAKTGSCIIALLVQERRSWSEHVARMGTEDRPQHLLKAVIMHRNLAWWRKQHN